MSTRPMLPPLSTDYVPATPGNTREATETANASPSDFDFGSYMRAIDSAQTYTLTEIGRGPSWVTIKARKQLQQASDLGQNIAHNFGAFPHHENLLLTHRPVTVVDSSAGDNGQTNPLRIEYGALLLFEEPPYPRFSPPDLVIKIRSLCRSQRWQGSRLQGVLHGLTQKTGVRIPEPLGYDPGVGILTTSYLPELCPLSRLFGSMFSLDASNRVSPPLGPAIRQLVGCENASQLFFKSVGRSLGRFLAGLHEPTTSRKLRRRMPAASKGMSGRTEQATRAMQEAIVRMKDRIKTQDWQYLFASSTELDEICEALKADLTRDIPASE